MSNEEEAATSDTDHSMIDSYHLTMTEHELTECDCQPLHLLGHLQGGAGHVIFFLRKNFRVVAVDQQILNVPWIRSSDSVDEPRHLLGKALVECFLSEHIKVEEDEEETTLPVAIAKGMQESSEAQLDRTCLFLHARNPEDMSSTYWSLSICCTTEDENEESVYCMEIEAIPQDHENNEGEEDPQFQNTLVRLGKLMHSAERQSITDLCVSACNEVYELFKGKYNRGMVYEFQDDLSGKVVHEVKTPDLPSSYLGLRFPAADIPKPARDLFFKNGLRYNYNIEETDNPILSISAQPLDLTQVRMRAIHKPHIIYLRNMGVISSLAVAVKVQGTLWGLLTFHRYSKTPFKPNLHQRMACETIASMLSTRMERINMEAMAERSQALNEVLTKWDKSAGVLVNMKELGEQVKAVCDADCVTVRVEEGADGPTQWNAGDHTLVPSPAGWKHLADLSVKDSATELITRQTRAGVLQMGFAAPEDCPAAGFCYFSHGGVQVFLGRALRSADVVWAGDPDLPKLRIGGILNPRASFEQFMEKARQESRRWSKGDLLVINLLRLHISG